MPRFDKKTVYHSDVVKSNGLTLKLTGNVREGKYGWIVPIHVQGDPDGHEYWMSIENDACVQVMQGVPQQTWGTLTAAGSRGVASLSWASADGAPAPAPAPAPAAAPQQSGGGDLDLEDIMLDSMIKAGRVVAAFRDEFNRDPTQVDQDLAVTIFIERNRRGL